MNDRQCIRARGPRVIGTVFAAELARIARGRLPHWARWAYGGWLVLMLYAWLATYYAEVNLSARPGVTADLAHDLVDFLVRQQTILILLVAPTFAAGAVTEEKVKGTLEPLFLADLRPGEIVLGKLLARVAAGLAWSLAAWPILALAGQPGGVTPAFFAALAAVTLLQLAGTCAVSLLISVWSRTTRDAVVGAYALAAVLIVAVALARFAGPKWSAVAALDPNYVLDTARDQPDYDVLRTRLRRAFVSWGILAFGGAGVAAWRLRPAFIKQQQSRQRRGIAAKIDYRPTLTERPVEWRERYSGRGPPRWLLLMAAGAAGTASTVALSASATPGFDELLSLHTLAIFLISLAAGVRASACVVGERDRRTWDVLLATPMALDTIIGEKLDAIVGSLRSYYLAFLAAGCIVLSLSQGGAAADWHLLTVAGLLVAGVVTAMDLFDALPTPLGQILLALAASFHSPLAALLAVLGPVYAEVGLRFMAGVGAWFSARCANDWLSLLGTVVAGYLVGSVVAAASLPVGCLSCCVVSVVFFLLEWSSLVGIAGSDVWLMAAVVWSFGSLVGLWWAGRQARASAVRYLERTERVPANSVRLNGHESPFERGLPKE